MLTVGRAARSRRPRRGRQAVSTGGAVVAVVVARAEGAVGSTVAGVAVADDAAAGDGGGVEADDGVALAAVIMPVEVSVVDAAEVAVVVAVATTVDDVTPMALW